MRLSIFYLRIICLNTLLLLSINSKAQTLEKLSPIYIQVSYIFDPDSLVGFNEKYAIMNAISEGYSGTELKVRLYQLKREYIQFKYNLAYNQPTFTQNLNLIGRAASCNNEDFEASIPGNITNSNQILGWSVMSGTNALPNNACNIGGCCPSQPVACELIQCPATGYIDPVIGNCYPLFSVYGNNTNNGNTVNPTLPQMKGSNIIRINNNFPQSGVARLSKTINVNASNALFQFAYSAVLSPGHPCCASTGFFINITNTTANTVIACPSSTIYSPAPGCSSVYPSTQFHLSDGTCGLNPSNNNNQPIFNKWSTGALYLTPFIGNNITIEVTVTDCATGAHYGYAYFDAQCSPLDIIGNTTSYPISSPSIVISNCGSTSNTVTAPPDVGPYTWTSTAISIPPNLSTPSNTNTTLISNQTGTVALIMNPPGICAPIIKVITLSLSPGPTVNLQVNQASCTNSTAIITVSNTPSTSNFSTITWSNPGTISSNSLTNYNAPIGSGTITITDNLGCFNSYTYNVISSPYNPTINSATIVPTTCGQSLGEIILNVTPSNSSFNWSPVVSTGSVASSLMAGNYLISINNQGCITNTLITISESNIPLVINTQTTASNCDQATGGATITAINHSNTYYWLPAVSTSSIANNLNPGEYTVTLGVQGCSISYLISIPQFEGPKNVNLLITDNLCSKMNGKIEIVNVNGGHPPYFYFLNGTNFNNINSYQNLNSGNYNITVKDQKGCLFSKNINLKNIVNQTKLYYKIQSDGNCEEMYSIIVDSISGGTKPYLISINKSPAFFADTIKHLTEPEYNLTVIDKNGCETQNYISNRIIKNKPFIYIPNSFTPNNDGLNDEWFPYINCFYDYKCLIFDRWGILIKELNTINEHWDGYYKGKELPIGVYSYIIDITEFSSKAKRLTGHINLIK